MPIYFAFNVPIAIQIFPNPLRNANIINEGTSINLVDFVSKIVAMATSLERLQNASTTYQALP